MPEEFSVASQFEPDYKVIVTAAQAETYFGEDRFKFQGPGWYSNKGDWMLVIPVTEKKSQDPWTKTWPDSTLFKFCVYTGRNPRHAFNKICRAPMREEK